MRIKINEEHRYILQFFCPGCQEFHAVYLADDHYSGPTWTWNGDVNFPTITPSIMIKTGKHVDPSWEEPEGEKEWSTICHSLITNGYIHFVTDSTHGLAGTSIALPEL